MGMRRKTILSLTAAATLAAAPAAAIAHGGGHDHGPGNDATPVATVASFADGKLTLTLTDGSTLAGKVTDRTRLTCESAKPTASKASFKGRHHGEGKGRHRYRWCGTENLTAGATVTDAELSATTAGAVFREVDLLK